MGVNSYTKFNQMSWCHHGYQLNDLMSEFHHCLFTHFNSVVWCYHEHIFTNSLWTICFNSFGKFSINSWLHHELNWNAWTCNIVTLTSQYFIHICDVLLHLNELLCTNSQCTQQRITHMNTKVITLAELKVRLYI